MSKGGVLTIVILGILLGFSVIFNFIQKANNKQLTEDRTELKNSLHEASLELDSALVANDNLLELLEEKQYIVDSLGTVVKNNKSQLWRLNNELAKLEQDIVDITSDTAYVKLKEMYASEDTRNIYDFSKSEVVGIYKDVSVIPYKDSIIITQDTIIDQQVRQLSLKQEIVITLGQGNEAKQELIERLYQDKVYLLEQMDQQEVDNRQLKKTLRLWQTGSIAAGGALILILLLL